MNALRTKAAVRSWRRRWKAAADAERKELRAMTPDDKLRHLGMLMASAPLFGPDPERLREETRVRNRWNRLRRLAGV